MAEERNLTKRWIVEEVIVHTWGEVVPLRIDPKTGEFWFEYPPRDGEGLYGVKGEQYVGRDRQAMTALIGSVIDQNKTLEWSPFIAINTVPEYSRGKPDLPQVGFVQLIRFERAEVDVEVPTWNPRNKQHDLENHKKLKDPNRGEYGWKVVRRVRYRYYQGDTESFCGTKKRGYVPTSEALVLPYNDELWQTLCGIHDACLEMHRRLKGVLGGSTEEVVAKLLALQNGRLLTMTKNQP